MTVFSLPDLGEGLQEAEIVAWQVSVGDHVITDQPLVSVETDKAVVEIPAPYSGTIKKLMGDVGDIVATGAPLVEIATGSTEDKGAIVGDLIEDQKTTEKPFNKPLSKAITRDPQASAEAAPAVRRLAKEKGIDLSSIIGSGPGGSILSGDILAATPRRIEGKELRGVRRAMARAMTKSHATIVPATVTDHADIHCWLPGEVPIFRLARAITVACKTEPALNAWFDGTHRQLHDHVDLAIAIDTNDGLFAPVIRSLDTITDIGEQISTLKKAADTRSVTSDQMKGATFTLSNFGMIGGEFASLVVTPPQVAILGAGRITDAVVATGGAAVVHTLLPLSLTFDHRVVTGGEAARFLAALRADLEQSDKTKKGSIDG
jgi:2-oxoisovalerate dehydrogenase E2 component (dihydrolipoyl transacylase)